MEYIRCDFQHSKWEKMSDKMALIEHFNINTQHDSFHILWAVK